jgi:hypothetical protein
MTVKFETQHQIYEALRFASCLIHVPVNMFSQAQTEGEYQGSRRLSAALTWGCHVDEEALHASLS